MSVEHNLVMIEEKDIEIVYQCTNCKQVVGFGKEEFAGEPNVKLRNDVWLLPENAGVYISPCFKTCETCGQVLPDIEDPLPEQSAVE
jgi:hypothetical protein